MLYKKITEVASILQLSPRLNTKSTCANFQDHLNKIRKY